MKRRILIWISVVAAAIAAMALTSWVLVLRPVVLRVPDALPDAFAQTGFSHAALEELLKRFVTPDGRVRYQEWHDDPDALKQLDLYLGAVARYGPNNAPDRFPEQSHRLAYWMNAYNACVIRGVLEHWPLDSVRDVRAPLEPKAGFGFFYRLRFVLGGETMSLYTLEHSVIRGRFTDPRIHFVLNCASDGCPRLRPELPTGDALEAHLAETTRDFLADPNQVRIDHAARRVALSQIFEWYQEDFILDLTRRGFPTEQRTLLVWLTQAASESLAAELERASDYEIVFADYDWDVNAATRDPR